MDDVYLLNSPFTFQSMEKHAAYCAMIRLGLKVPPTVLVPHKDPPDNSRFQYTADKYNQPFDLAAIAEQIGYPLFMKPYDGGQWIGVSRIVDRAELERAYDASGQRMMHLQASVEGFDVFARSLSIGPETMIMKFQPERPMHDRYAVAHDFLSPEVGEEVLTISRLINAFFRWEFNSCECLVRGDQVHPIDYANASPDVALTSLHYYFPRAIKTLLAWCTFCLVTHRRPRLDLDTRRYFEIADREDLDYGEKLAAYRRLADEHFEVDRYQDFCASRLAHSTSSCSTGSPRPTSTACWSTPCARPTRRTSTTGSWPTCAGWSGSGCASRARHRPGRLSLGRLRRRPWGGGGGWAGSNSPVQSGSAPPAAPRYHPPEPPTGQIPAFRVAPHGGAGFCPVARQDPAPAAGPCPNAGIWRRSGGRAARGPRAVRLGRATTVRMGWMVVAATAPLGIHASD